MCQPIGLCMCCVSLFVCMYDSKQSSSKKPSHALALSKMTPCCVKHNARSLWH